MKPIKILATTTTPNIEFDIENNKFVISGVSMPEDPISFYTQIVEWIDLYAQSPVKDAEFEIYLDYFNSSSAKVLMDIMKKIKGIGMNNQIVWIYDETDEELMEAGQEFTEIIGSTLKLRALRD